MIRLLIFIAVLFVAALGSAWIADRPGLVTLDWQGYRIEVGLMTAVVALAVLVAICIALWNLLLFVLRSPGLLGRFFRRRRRDRGYDALSRSMVALGVGDAVTASRYGKEAGKLLAGEPAADLVLAQSAQLAGRHDEARARFEAMLEDPKLRPVGLHGLYIEAERLGEPVAARHYASEAARLVPGLPWAGHAVLAYEAVAGDWEDAVKSLERNYASKLVDKKTFRRHKAVLLTAHALELEDRDPDAARSLAGEAHGLAPDLVPAAVLAARLATRRGDVRKAMKIIETTWKVSPHPDLAEAYANARTGDSAQDRLKRVKSLAALRAHNVEGAVALARAAIEAGDYGLAREKLKAALTLEPTRRVFLLMADLEDAENGDRGRVREWLSRAVHAPADPAWVADGVVSETWAPVSPVDGRLDAFVWTLPPASEPKGEAVEAIEDSLLEALPAAPAGPVETLEILSDATVSHPHPDVGSAGDTARAAPSPAADVPEEPVESAAVEEPAASDEKAADEAPHAKQEPAPKDPAGTDAAGRDAPASNGSARGKAAAEAPAPASGAAQAKPETVEKSEKADGSKREKDLSRPIEFPLKHMPDDPGPDGDDDDDGPKKPPGYRFFN
jgi:HemY protein